MVKISFDVPFDEEQQQWDLRQSFDAMDDDKLGKLSIDQSYTLVLGLGYLQDYKAQDRFTPQILKDAVQAIQQQEQEEQGTVQYGEDGVDDSAVNGKWVTLDVLQKVLEMHSSLLKRDRNSNIQHGFDLMAGGDKKGSIDVSDIQKLATEIGEPISKEEAQAMITMTQQLVTGTPSEEAGASLDYATFQQLMGPPDE